MDNQQGAIGHGKLMRAVSKRLQGTHINEQFVKFFFGKPSFDN